MGGLYIDPLNPDKKKLFVWMIKRFIRNYERERGALWIRG
jgi:hypothetical protein